MAKWTCILLGALAMAGAGLYAADRPGSVGDDVSGALYGGDCTVTTSLSKCPTPKEEPKCKATQGYSTTSGGSETGLFSLYCTGDSQLTQCGFLFDTAKICATTTQQ
jgi:hypothetical protein